MSESSHSYSKQNSQEPKHFRGGEKKVMKKSLTAILAASMAFSMFASAAFAADEAKTTEQKFQEMKTAGIFQGYPDGKSHLDATMTRAEFAKALANLLGLDDNADAAKVYSDVAANHWAVGEIGALTAQQIIEGVGAGKFGPKVVVSIEQLAKIAADALKLEIKEDATVEGKTSKWATSYVAAAVEAGLIKKSADYTVNATRGDLVDASYIVFEKGQVASVKEVKVIDDKNIEVVFSDGEVVKKELETALKTGETTTVKVEYKGKSYDVKVSLDALKQTGAKQTGAKKITVSFNQPVPAADRTAMKFDVKRGAAIVSITPKWATDNKSVVLEAGFLAAGDYTVKVNDGEATEVKVEAEKASKIDIAAPAIQFDAVTDLGVKVLNQFDEALVSGASVTAYNATNGKAVDLSGGNKIDLKVSNTSNKSETKIGDTINVMAIYPSAGLSVNKPLKVINGSAATSIKLGEAQPQKDKTRISVSETGLVLPLELVDANGQKLKLPQADDINPNKDLSFTYAGLFFYVSDKEILTKLSVDADGVLKFNTGTKAGTVYVTITNGATGASSQVAIVVNAIGEIKEFQLGYPSVEVVKGEDVVFPFTAVDAYGEKVKLTDAHLTGTNAAVQFYGANWTNPPKVNAKGELVLNFLNSGTQNVAAVVKGIQNSQVSITVRDTATITAVKGIKDFNTTLEATVQAAFGPDQIELVDNYGRVSKGANLQITSDTPGVVDYDGTKLVAKTKGTAKITVKSTKNANITDYTFEVKVINSDEIKTYDISKVGTIFGGKDADKNHSVAITLVGKDASGNTVTLVDNKAPFVTTDNESVIAISDTNKGTIIGKKAGEATIAVTTASGLTATQKVTVSEDAPTAAEIKFTDSDLKVVGNATTTAVVTVKDQYGKVIDSNKGFFSAADPKIATVTSSGTITGVANGYTTLTYTAANGKTATATITVSGK